MLQCDKQDTALVAPHGDVQELLNQRLTRRFLSC